MKFAEREPLRDRQALPAWGKAAPIAVFVLLLISLLAWRVRVYYTGGLDPVVAGKAIVGLAAFALAWFVAPAGFLDRLRPRTVIIALCFVAVSLIGALADGNLVASIVLAVRVLMVLGTVGLLVTSFSPAVLIRSYAASMCGVGAVLAVTGIPSFIADGRLAGGLLPAGPNQMSMLFGPPILILVWRVTHGRARAWQLALVAALVGLTWVTGSRAGLLGLAVGVLLLMVAPRMQLGTISTLVIGIPAVAFVASFTGVLSAYFGRGGTQDLTTLNSRTIAWRAAFSAGQDFFPHWFGGGFAVKTVSVTDTYWEVQVVDSSWVSAFVQAGVLGLLLLALWSITTLWGAARDRTHYRRLWLAMAAYAVLRSALETGLLDTYVLFVVMLVPALMIDLRKPGGDPSADGEPLKYGLGSTGDVDIAHRDTSQEVTQTSRSHWVLNPNERRL